MKLCTYCGEEKATEMIINPNGLMEDECTWEVCKPCKEIIKNQQKLVFASMLNHMSDDKPDDALCSFRKEYAAKLEKEAKENIERISRESGSEPFTITLKKNKGDEKSQNN